MDRNPTVLLLVHNADEREAISRRLVNVSAIPIPVHADRAVEAVNAYRPVAAVLDHAHASTTPRSFLDATSVHRVRVVTLLSPNLGVTIDDETLHRALAVSEDVAEIIRAC